MLTLWYWQLEGKINWQARLAPEHQFVRGEASHLVPGAIVGMDQGSHMITPTGLVLILESAQHIKQGTIKSFHGVAPRMVWGCPHLVDSSHLTRVP